MCACFARLFGVSWSPAASYGKVLAGASGWPGAVRSRRGEWTGPLCWAGSAQPSPVYTQAAAKPGAAAPPAGPGNLEGPQGERAT